MTELTHHDRDDAFHEIQLSGKQLVFLFMAGTSLAVAIFLCGVKVGREARIDRGTVSDSADSLASAAPAPASTPTQPAASGGPPAAEPPAPAAEPEDELSYAKRLQSTSPPVEKLKPREEKPAPKVAAPPPAPEPVHPASKAAAPAPAAAAPPVASSSTGRPGAWIVQVISLQDRAAAGKFARQLSAKGYPAFVLDPAPGAPRIYRVQVGGYAEKNDAEQASRRLEKDEQLKPLVRSR